MSRRGLVLLAILLGLGLLVLAIRQLDAGTVRRVLAEAHLWPWLPLGLLSYAIGHRLRGLRLRRMLSHEVAMTPHTATNVVVVGYASNNLLPWRLGEAVRAWLLMERSGLSLTQTLTITLVERLFDVLALMALFAAVTLVLPASTAFAAFVSVLAGLVAGPAFLLALLTWVPGPVLAFASRTTNRVLPRAHDAVMRQVDAVLGGLGALRDPRGLAAVAGLSVLVWLAEAGLYLALLPAFDLAARPLDALLAMTSANLGLLAPSGAGFAGPFVEFCVRALATLGVPRDTGFAYAVLVHATFFVAVTLYGVVVLVSYGFAVGRTLALSREARLAPAGAARVAPRPAAFAEPRPSRFSLALAEAAVPLDRDGLSGEAAAAVLAEVAGFVDGQMRELPVRLRALFHAGLAGFRAATRLRYARGFCELPPTTRRAWFERWAYGTVPLARQLFRPVRSIALLAYYERPEVRSAMDAEPVAPGGVRSPIDEPYRAGETARRAEPAAPGGVRSPIDEPYRAGETARRAELRTPPGAPGPQS